MMLLLISFLTVVFHLTTASPGSDSQKKFPQVVVGGKAVRGDASALRCARKSLGQESAYVVICFVLFE